MREERDYQSTLLFFLAGAAAVVVLGFVPLSWAVAGAITWALVLVTACILFSDDEDDL